MSLVTIQHDVNIEIRITGDITEETARGLYHAFMITADEWGQEHELVTTCDCEYEPLEQEEE